MNELAKVQHAIEQPDPIPTAISDTSSKLFACAYDPQINGPIRAPYGPAYDSGWLPCPPHGWLQELPMGGGPPELPMGGKLHPLPIEGKLTEIPVGGRWQKIPYNDRLPGGSTPYLQNMELVGPGLPHNKHIGYARSTGGGTEFVAKARSRSI